MIKVFNLTDSSETFFDEHTDKAYAVAYCYCMENNRASWFFSKVHDNAVKEALEELPMVYGKHSISCGDFATTL